MWSICGAGEPKSYHKFAKSEMVYPSRNDHISHLRKSQKIIYTQEWMWLIGDGVILRFPGGYFEQIFAEPVVFFQCRANEVHDMGWKERPAVCPDWSPGMYFHRKSGANG